MSWLKKKKMLCMFSSRNGFIANYFLRTTNKWILFTTVILCRVSFLAEQNASAFNTSQLCACCSENKTNSCPVLDPRTAMPHLLQPLVPQIRTGTAAPQNLSLDSFCSRHRPSFPLKHKVFSNFTYMFQLIIN